MNDASLNLDSFLLSLLCVVFVLLGLFAKDWFFQTKLRDWPSMITYALILGLFVFFGRTLLPVDARGEGGMAFVSAVTGLIGGPILQYAIKRPLKILEAMKTIKDLLNKDKKDE